MTALRVGIQGLGLLGPGLTSWAQGQNILLGNQTYVAAPTVLAPPARLPAAERRRAGASVKLAMAVADQAVLDAGIDPSTLATVFTSSGAEGSNCHVLCAALAAPQPLLSPTRFTNSVHNAASGCWHIAVASQAASTSLCAFDGSFAAGLIDAATSVVLQGQPVLLVAYDAPYPEPLHTTRPLPDHLGVALLLTPEGHAGHAVVLSIELSAKDLGLTPCKVPELEVLRRTIPAAAALPLLQAVACCKASPEWAVIDYLPTLKLSVTVTARSCA